MFIRKFDLKQKICPKDFFFIITKLLFLLKNLFELALKYLFNVFIQFNTIFNLNFKLRIDQNCVS